MSPFEPLDTPAPLAAAMASGGSPAAWSDELAARWQALVETVHQRLDAGLRLEPETRQAFEGLLGQDVGQVLVHRGGFPGLIAAAAQADAVTLGSHVLGSSSQLDSGTARGTALLGHEVAHAVLAPTPPPAPAPPPLPTQVAARPAPVHAPLPRIAAAARRAPVPAAPLFQAPAIAVQRATGEEAAQAAEAALLSEAPAAAPARIDAEQLAELVYRRLRDDVLIERERLAWSR